MMIFLGEKIFSDQNVAYRENHFPKIKNIFRDLEKDQFFQCWPTLRNFVSENKMFMAPKKKFLRRPLFSKEAIKKVWGPKSENEHFLIHFFFHSFTIQSKRDLIQSLLVRVQNCFGF